jgi:hypothetical protein
MMFEDDPLALARAGLPCCRHCGAVREHHTADGRCLTLDEVYAYLIRCRTTGQPPWPYHAAGDTETAPETAPPQEDAP